MQFVHAFDAIFELATVLRELLGYFVDAAWIAPRGERRIPSQSKYRTAMPRGAVQANASTRMLPYEGPWHTCRGAEEYKGRYVRFG
jgi:hypothetical protein